MDEHTAVDAGMIARWADTFNTDVERMITELYAPDCSFSGVQLGHEKLRTFELRVLAAAPRRTISVEQTHSAGDVITVEGVLLDPDRGEEWRLAFCAVLTWHDGKIVRDNTYADMSRWPGAS